MKRVIIVILTCVLALLAVLAAVVLRAPGVQAASQSACGTWNVVSSPNVAGGDTSFAAVAAVSTDDVWAVGNIDNANSSIARTLIEHWDGSRWHIVPSPNVGTEGNTLFGVTASSSTNAWAVGYYINSNAQPRSLIEHWDGKRWNVVAAVDPGSASDNLFGVTASRDGSAWVVGYYRNTGGIFQTLIERWNGSHWQQVSSPNPGLSGNLLYGVTAISANTAWAVGQDLNNNGPGYALVEQWNGSRWSVISTPAPKSATDNFNLMSVAAISADSAWAVGDVEGPHPSHTLIERWNGSHWNIVPSPNAGSLDDKLYGIASISSSAAWAVGAYYIANGSTRTLIEQWDGSHWHIVPSPNPGTGSGNDILGGVAATSASNVFAAGDYDTGGNSETLVEHHC